MVSRPSVPSPRPRALALWLTLTCGLIVLMIMVGGITRLTESGLSITRWEPVSGALPPLDRAGWEAEFARYRETPQFRELNASMDLGDFQAIYFWEYVHRLLGRVIGLAFALPLAWFWYRRAIPPGYGRRLGAIFALGAVQGGVGWWMVSSGLVDVPEVSHLRLAVHLLLAFALLGAAAWTALDLNALASGRTRPRMTILALWGVSLLFLQMLFGAYVAGLEAGYAFNSWPLMGDNFFPADTPMLRPVLRNLVDNPTVVQFIHRWLAFIVAGLLIGLAAKTWARRHRIEAGLLAIVVILQIQLGVLTLVSGVRIEFALAHQGMAALLLAAALVAAHRLGEEEP